MAEPSDKMKNPVIIPYLKAIPKGIQDGIVDLVQTTINVIAHPVDELLYPTYELAQDFLIITIKHYESDNTSVYHKGLLDTINQNPAIYQDALTRMNRRIKAIKSLEEEFLAAPGPKKLEMLTKLSTTILLPGYAIKGFKAVNEVVMNKYHFGTLKPQPKFDVRDKIPSPWLKLDRPIKRLSIDEIRQSSDLMYVINHKRELIITDFHYDHWHLGEGKPVYAAGDIRLAPPTYKKGDSWHEVERNSKSDDKWVIFEIDNRSGSYAPPNTNRPEGVGLKDLVENAFIKFGLPDAKGKYTDWRPNRGKPHTLSTVNDYTPPSTLGFMAGTAVAINPDAPIKISNSSLLISEAQAKESYNEHIIRLKRIINKASSSSGDELIKSVKKIERSMEELGTDIPVGDYLTDSEIHQLNKILERTEHVAIQKITYSVESFVDDVNAVFDRNHFNYRYKVQKQNQNTDEINNFDAIPILHTAYNVFSFFNEKEANRLAAQVISGTQIAQGIPEIHTAFEEQGIAGIFSSGFGSGADSILKGLSILKKLFGEQKDPNAATIKMLQGISNQVARLHQDVLEGFRQVFLALGLMDLRMAYGFQNLELLAKQQHAAAMTILKNMQAFLAIDRSYLQSLSESVKRIELGLNIHEIDKEDWSPELSKINTKMAIYQEEGINRKEFYNILIDLTELLQQSRIKAINRAKKVDINSYYALSRALSTQSSSLGTEHSGHFEDITLSSRFRSIGEQQINVILKYVISRFQNEGSLSKKISAIKNPPLPLYPIEQFNPIALSEITGGIIQLIDLYKKGVFCPNKITQDDTSKNCRLNKIEVLEKLKQIQQYYDNYEKVLVLFSDPNLIRFLVSDYSNSYQQFNDKARKLLTTKMQRTYQEDLSGYYNRLEQLTLDLKQQQSLSLDIGTHLSCPYPSLGTTFSSFSDFEWVGLWPYGWRGRGWGVTCGNWAPCGQWYGPGDLINISKQRYIHDIKQAYQAELQKQIESIEKSIKSRNQQKLNCHNIYLSANLTKSNHYMDCMPQIYYAYSSNPKLFNGKKIILPTDHPWIKQYIHEELRRYLIPGFSWLDFQFDIHNGNELLITPIWRNAKTNDSYQYPTLQYNIPVHAPFALEEGLFHHWFGGGKPTGSCIEYDESLKRPSSRGDTDASNYYYSKLSGGTNWPAGNLVYTGGDHNPGTAWMRLLFMRPETQAVKGVIDNPEIQPDKAISFSTFDYRPLILQKTEQFLNEKRIFFFKDYLMHLLLPDSSVHSSLRPEESEVREALIELDVKEKILKAVISLAVDFTKVDMDPVLMTLFDKDSIIAHLNRYKGGLLTLFDQNDLNIKQLPTFLEKISRYFSERGNVPFKPSLIDSTKRDLDKLISIEADHAITPLEEAIYPETEKDIIEHLNPLAKTMASLQMASEIVKRNPQKLSYLGPMLQSTHRMIGDALKSHKHLLDTPEVGQKAETNVALKPGTVQINDGDSSDANVNNGNPTSNDDKSSPPTFFGIPMANAEEIRTLNEQRDNAPQTSSATRRFDVSILATFVSFFKPRTPSLFVNPSHSDSKPRNIRIRPLLVNAIDIQELRTSFDTDFATQIDSAQNDKTPIKSYKTQTPSQENCGLRQKYVLQNAETGASFVCIDGNISHTSGPGKSLIFVGPNSRVAITGFKPEDRLSLPPSNRHDGLPKCQDVPQGSILTVGKANIAIGIDASCEKVLPRTEIISQNNNEENFKAAMAFIKTTFFHSSLFLHGLAFLAAFREEIASKLLWTFANGDKLCYESWQKGLKEFRDKNAIKIVSDISEMAVRLEVAKDLQVTENTTHIAKDFMQALMTSKKEPKVYLGLLARAFDEAAFLLDKALPYVSISGLTQILTKTYAKYIVSSSKMEASHALVDNLPLLIPGSRGILDSLDEQDKYLNRATRQVSEPTTIEIDRAKPMTTGLRRRIKQV